MCLLRMPLILLGMPPKAMTTTYPHARSLQRPRRERAGVLALPLFVMLGLTSAAIGFIGYVLWPRWPGPPVAANAPSLPITVAGTAFNVPPAAVRVRMQRQPGAHMRLDLAFLWPSLEPPDPAATPEAPSKGSMRPQPMERIFVTIVMAGDTLAPPERVKTIYPRYAVTEPVAGPEGLAVLAFRDGTPYQGEDLVYDGVTPENFIVRCSRNGFGQTPGTCLYTRRIETADVTVRFPRDWLEDWRTVAANIDRLITRLLPRG
jgi:hypothetical protein